MLAKFCDGLNRIACLCGQFHVALGRNDSGQAFAENGVILYAQDPNSLRFRHADHPSSMGDILRLGEQFSLITEPPHLDRTRTKIESVEQRDQYEGLETSSEKSRRCSGSLLKNIGSTLRIMRLSADQLTSMLMYECWQYSRANLRRST